MRKIAGALKNVIAIAAGIAAGLGYGDNTKAALITRGLAELARLGIALGGEPLTFSGLAGMGDLVATCTSDKSRNRRVGVELGKGRKLEEIVAESNMVAEGVKSTGQSSTSRCAQHRHADRRDGRCRPVRRRHTGRDRADAHVARGEARAPRHAVTRVGILALAGGSGARGATVDDVGVVIGDGLGWTLDWRIGADDRWRIPQRETAVRQSLVESAPVVRTAMRVPGGDAIAEVYGAPDGGGAVVVEITNGSPAPFVAAFVVRGARSVALDGSTVIVDNRRGLLLPRAPSRWSVTRGGSTDVEVCGGAAARGSVPADA